jgi:hypothetical protein
MTVDGSTPRCAHFDVIHEQAVSSRPDDCGTRNPDPSSGWSMASRGTTRTVSTTDAWSMPDRKAAASGARPASRRPVT